MPHTACVILLWAVAGAAAGVPEPIFYLPFDGSMTAAVAGGGSRPDAPSHQDMILAYLAARSPRFRPGKVGQAYAVVTAPLVFPAEGNFRPDEGSVAFWLSPHFRGDDKGIYCTFFGAEKWGMIYKYLKHTTLTFGTAKPDRDIYYDCNVRSIADWRPGQWRHVAATWSRQANARHIYVDGQLAATAPFPHHRAFQRGPMFVGGGCQLYPQHLANALLDEVAAWDQALTPDAVRVVHDMGARGVPLVPVQATGAPARTADGRLAVIEPQGPAAPEVSAPKLIRSATRERLSLDGWWHFVPAAHEFDRVPERGWGWMRVPGHFTTPGAVIGPDGKPTRRRWQGEAWSRFGVAYYQRSVAAPAHWQGRRVVLNVDGLDGRAEIYVNGAAAGELLCWEDESFAVGDLLRYGETNAVTIVLHAQGGDKASGVYGSVWLEAVPQVFVRDVVVQTRVARQQIAFSCDLWAGRDGGDLRLAFEVCPAEAPGQVEQRFEEPLRLRPDPGQGRALYGRTQRTECAFAWPRPRLWTYDDPHLYVVRARAYRGEQLVDETGWHRFGFREFTMRGSRFFLNGVPTHLRGHQTNLAWSNQLEWMRDFKRAGMNAVEVAGPISSRWNTGRPYRAKLFGDMLSYADDNGMVTMPSLPDARVFRERITDPEVAALYRRRVDKHIRRYGNHPSVCMWMMNFNLAGYRWYHPPSKIDGSYKPSDDTFVGKERYSLEAQRICQSIDPRPIYHHSCGNFGDIYNINCYIGPTCPLQEREEWPSRWAEKRPFPLMACEHGLWLVPYWYRPRQFPLGVVYAGEPIFDELTAMMLGPRAYQMVTPKLLEIYGLDKKRQRERLKQLVAMHPGYQEVKSLIARHSLRSWRAYGVSGIIYNALQWDFRDAAGNPSPVMRSQQRYFGPMDLYIAGPRGDRASKDHAYWVGERMAKQMVLLNDLTHDVEDTLHIEILDKAGAHRARAMTKHVTFKAGVPTFLPLSYGEVDVPERTEFTVTVRCEKQPSIEDSIHVQFFPRPAGLSVTGPVLVYDPVGRTKAMLGRAGLACDAFTPDSNLARARLVVVGRESFDAAFVELAGKTKLEQAVADGLNLLVFEQTKPLLGLTLKERSTRRAFIAWQGHPALDGLAPRDFVDLRGESDLIEPYPDPPAETQKKWPERYFKWGNRGVVATFVFTKPHHGPYVPILHSGFDLVESPLMQARIGRGRVVLCQVDVTSRYAADPVSTLLANNLVRALARRADAPERWQVVAAADAAKAKGLRLARKRWFAGRVSGHPLLAGLSDGDLFLKQWRELPAIEPANGWTVIVEPGVVAIKGKTVACAFDPAALGETRGGIKATRFASILRSNAGEPRPEWRRFITAPPPAYEPNEWERLPVYINW